MQHNDGMQKQGLAPPRGHFYKVLGAGIAAQQTKETSVANDEVPNKGYFLNERRLVRLSIKPINCEQPAAHFTQDEQQQ